MSTDRIDIVDERDQAVGFSTPQSLAAKSDIVAGKQYTTVEVFEHLLALTNDPERRADVQRHLDEIKRRYECAGQ